MKINRHIVRLTAHTLLTPTILWRLGYCARHQSGERYYRKRRHCRARSTIATIWIRIVGGHLCDVSSIEHGPDIVSRDCSTARTVGELRSFEDYAFCP